MGINKDITISNTLSGNFYKSESEFEKLKNSLFPHVWQYIADESYVEDNYQIYPYTLLDGVLNEPLILTNNGGEINSLSNVCTHRAKILVEKPKAGKLIGCGYHGRCFTLDGKYHSMPEFKEAKDFPSEHDHLTHIPLKNYLGLFFNALDPKIPFDQLIAPVDERVSFLPLDTLIFDESRSKSYDVNANWALYVDNYLEGFHVPYIHPSLQKALDFKQYEYHLFDYCNLQTGVAKEGEPVFQLPEGHIDYGKNIYAYYFWLFPNMMLNFYPWGLSLNYIQPVSYNKTKVIFRTYRFKGTSFQFEDNNIDITELEDEAVVESVQKGVQSRYYKSGRFSPTMEQCVHHFHLLMKEFAVVS